MVLPAPVLVPPIVLSESKTPLRPNVKNDTPSPPLPAMTLDRTVLSDALTMTATPSPGLPVMVLFWMMLSDELLMRTPVPEKAVISSPFEDAPVGPRLEVETVGARARGRAVDGDQRRSGLSRLTHNADRCRRIVG